MTENEKLFLNENARIYHVGRPAPVRKKRSRSIVFCAAAAVVLALWEAPDNGHFTDMVRIAAQASAGVELMCFDGIFSGNSTGASPADNANIANEAEKNVNNISETILPSDEDDILMLSKGSRRMPSSADEESLVEDFLPEPADSGTPLPYAASSDGSKSGRITQTTYTAGKGENYIDLPMGGQIRNVTKLSADEIAENAALLPDFKIKMNAPADEPQVLIMHTHTTESYEPYQRDYYDDSFTSRTTDMSKNMAAVGDVMTEVFEKNGIRTYHDTTIHDYPSYNGSYDRSRVTVEGILEKYPSIKVVLDVHRDAIEREDGERIAPSVTVNGKSSAQVMIICGCDDGTMGMPDCMKNLRTAALFQQYMESSFSGLTRPVLYDYRKYNQDMTTGSLLIEVGGHANSLDQALYAGELTAQGISEALISIGE